MDKLKSFERETSFTYNQEDKTVSCFTMDPSLIRRLTELSKDYEEVQFIKQDHETFWFKFPKKWLKVHTPRKMTDEQREECRERGRALAELRKGKLSEQ